MSKNILVILPITSNLANDIVQYVKTSIKNEQH